MHPQIIRYLFLIVPTFLNRFHNPSIPSRPRLCQTRTKYLSKPISGGAGEVGRHLMKDFFQEGYKVTILDRAPKVPEKNEKLPVTYLQGNLTDAALVNKAVQGKDVIINLASSFADDPQTVFGEDLKGHINLLEAASSSRIHSFIYTSTATVYGRAVFHPVMETHPCLVGDARKPLYALGKYTAEELCKLYHKEWGLVVTIFRFWWAFGENIGDVIYRI